MALPGWIERRGTSAARLADFDERLPSAQNAVDLVPGWNAAIPHDPPLDAGKMALFADPRLAWLLSKLGPLTGRSVLELGPLEGGHSFMLERAGAASIDAVEANKLAYLRCLIFKEIVGLKTARFHLGDFLKWLDEVDRSYDLIVASGVLYHMRDPLRCLELIARRSATVYFWTHYVTDEAMSRSDRRRSVFVEDETQRFRDNRIRLYRRSYHGADRTAVFSGGPTDEHRWMHRDDFLRVLALLGFDDVQIKFEQPDHVNGPAFSVIARKPGGIKG
jgi:hypothetical protein